MIESQKVDEVRNAVDIVEVVGEHVKLKRQGGRFVGLCPFHKEKSPSFSVDPANKLFYCFGCAKGGDVFTFVREVEGVGFLDAVRGLAEKYHVPLPEEGAPDQERASLQESVHGALRFAGRFFYGQLTKTDEGKGALDYLTRRGLTPETIKQYGLGYAPERWDALALAAASEGIPEDVLEAAGLVIRRKDARPGASGVYDRYRGRVIFPIFSHTGRVVGFGGRIMTDAKDQPKYINSPETVVYSKSRVLYGLYAGRQEIRRTEEAVFVEGYTDVLAMHQAGLTNAVATCGTALTPDQVALVGRFAKRIVLLYDGDSAGLTAAVKGAETVVANWTLDPDEEKSTRAAGLGEVLRKGLIVYVVALPPGEDPDSYARQHGAEALREYVQKHRQDFVAFAFEAAARAGRLATPEGKAEVQEEIVGTIARLPSPLLQENYLARAAEVLKVPLPRLHETLERYHRAPRAREDAADARQNERDDRPEAPRRVAPVMVPAESVLLRVMLQEGDPMVEHVLGRMGLDEFSDGAVRAVVEALIAQYEAGAVESSAFLGGAFGPDVQHLAALVLSQQSYLSEGWREQNVQMTEDAYGAAESAMMLLKLRRVDDAIAEQRAACRAAEADGTLESAQRRLMQLQDVRKSIERRDFLNDAEAA